MRFQKVIKVGNALGVIIPAQIARDCKIKRGDYLELRPLNYKGSVWLDYYTSKHEWKARPKKSRST